MIRIFYVIASEHYYSLISFFLSISLGAKLYKTYVPERKIIFASRTEKLEKRLRNRGKSPLPAERVCHLIRMYNSGRCKNIVVLPHKE